MVDFTIIPQKTALINVDMQNCFVAGSPISAPDGLALLERINLFTGICRQAEILVIHTAFVLNPDGSNLGILAKTSPPAKAGMLNKGSESAALHPRLRVEPEDVILEKPRFGAFHGTNLEHILRERGIDTVIISGIAANVCCETTAREAMVRDFQVLFLSDGTSAVGPDGVTADQLQQATLANMEFLFAQVLTIGEMCEKIGILAPSA